MRKFSEPSELNELVKYCKDSGTILIAEPKGLQYSSETHGGEKHTCLLYKAVYEFQREDGHYTAQPSGIQVSHALLAAMQEELLKPSSEVRKISTVSVRKAFVYFDVSDFSMYPALRQALVINSIADPVRFTEDDLNLIGAVDKLCIGDGYIFVLDNGNDAAWFAAVLAHEVQNRIADKALAVKYHFRMSVHAGPVFSFWDIGKSNWNYVGDAINGGQRVLAAIGKEIDDVIFISEEILQELRASRNEAFTAMMLRCIENRGRHKDKHGLHWRVHQLNHERLMLEYKQEKKAKRRDRFVEMY